MRPWCALFACALALSGAGCGFHRVLPLGGGDDGGAGASDDLAGTVAADLAGTTAPADLAGGGPLTDDGGTVVTGPGPLGALPVGFCCNSDAECRGRSCMNDGPGPKFCVEDCIQTSDCDVFGPGFFCDTTIMRCRPTVALYQCHDPSTWVVGSKPTGGCCDVAATPPGAACLGGWCIHTGVPENPAYCTQGCKVDEDCPTGQTCDVPDGHCQAAASYNGCS